MSIFALNEIVEFIPEESGGVVADVFDSNGFERLGMKFGFEFVVISIEEVDDFFFIFDDSR